MSTDLQNTDFQVLKKKASEVRHASHPSNKAMFTQGHLIGDDRVVSRVSRGDTDAITLLYSSPQILKASPSFCDKPHKYPSSTGAFTAGWFAGPAPCLQDAGGALTDTSVDSHTHTCSQHGTVWSGTRRHTLS
jgi:hypothetical protein